MDPCDPPGATTMAAMSAPSELPVIAITGAGGFLGQLLRNYFEQAGHTCIGIDR